MSASINANNGRDHFPRVTPAVLGGGPFGGGRVVGCTNASGTKIEGPSYQVADLFATIFRAMGINPNEEFETSFGAPTTVTEAGSPIPELF